MGPMDKNNKLQQRVQTLIKEVRESNLHTPHNKKLILEFCNTCRAKKLSDYRICFYLERIKKFAQIRKKDFKDWERKDVEYVMAKLGEQNYSAWTIENHKVAFKVFFRWLYGLEGSDPAPKIVRWIKKEAIPSRIRKEDLLTRKDIRDMLNATKNPLHKALIAVLNTGGRPGEILGIRMKDITEVNGLVKIYVSGKMGKKMGERPLYLTEYIDEFKSWVRGHPNKHDPQSPLFLTQNGEFQYNNMEKIVKRLAMRAGIMRFRRDEKGRLVKNDKGKAEIEGKRVWLYLFRHTAGTRFYGKYEGSYARRLMGHVAGSRMEEIYCHLSEKDIEARLLGKELPEDSEPDIQKTENETENLLEIGKAIKKLSEQHPEILGNEMLKGILNQ